jgi:ferredoxin
MNAADLKEKLRDYALSEHIDMIGFAGIERFENAPAEFHPCNIYPETKTVIVIAIRVLRGLMESLDNGQVVPYNAHGYGGINEQFMREAKQRVACWLEDYGFSGVPVIQWIGSPHQEPIICHRTAAVAAGLGEIGWSKVFLSKKFGPLQRFGIILTDAVFPSDPLQIGQICDGCKACVRTCPGQAISKDEAFEFEISGETIRHAKVDMYKCTRAHHGSVKDTHPCPPDDFDISDINMKYETLRKETSKDETDDYALAHKAVTEVVNRYPHPLFSLVGQLGHSCAHCGAQGCYRACLEHLEKRGLLDKDFANQYRSKMKPIAKKEIRKYTRVAAKGQEVLKE